MDWLAELLISYPFVSVPVLGAATVGAGYFAARQLLLGVRMFRRKRALLQSLTEAAVRPQKRRIQA